MQALPKGHRVYVWMYIHRCSCVRAHMWAGQRSMYGVNCSSTLVLETVFY